MILPPYVRNVRGNLFYRPNPAMQARGFKPKALGPDCEAARAEGQRLWEAWLAAKHAQPKVTSYSAGTFGAYYDHFKLSEKWKRMRPRSREDYTRAWKHLGPRFGDRLITQISGTDCEDFIYWMEDNHSPNERYRTVKVLRALLKDAIVRLRLKYENPAKIAMNPQVPGRSRIWLGVEIARLIQTADEMGRPGTALAIAIAWDTLFAPVDVWTAKKAWIKRSDGDTYVERLRTKTDVPAYGYLTPQTAERLDKYLAGLGFELPDEAQFLRQPNGHAYLSKDTFGDHFREVRARAFPAHIDFFAGRVLWHETRTFMDIRRSGNVEADVAGADKETMGEILANNIAKSGFLDATYTPATVTKAKEVAKQRLEGRKRLASEISRLRTAGNSMSG